MIHFKEIDRRLLYSVPYYPYSTNILIESAIFFFMVFIEY